MNTATKNLENDHVHILKLINVMEHVTHTENPEISHIELIVNIVRNFADGIHHAKEENIFFPLLGERGFSPTQGPVAVMLHEHVEGRKYVKGIDDNIKLYKEGNNSALIDVFSNMNRYAALLRNHISKENNILFKMADNVLSESDQRDLLTRFAEAENNHVRPPKSADYPKQIQDLAIFYRL